MATDVVAQPVLSLTPTRKTFSTSAIAATSCMLLLMVYACCDSSRNIKAGGVFPGAGRPPRPSNNGTHATTESRSLLLGEGEDEEALMKKIRLKLRPVPLRFVEPSDGDEEVSKTTLQAHQVLHLHHMKTGGTSIDHMLRCAMDRMRKDLDWVVPYYSIHECSRSHFAMCLENATFGCRKPMGEAAIMSYCSALKYLDTFGWGGQEGEGDDGTTTEKNAADDHHQAVVRAFTVLRHPVDRVWSMFRFQTKNCYKCTPLVELYEKMESGETSGFDSLCLAQLQNHQVANLLSSTDWPVMPESRDVDDSTQHAMVAEAIENMKTFFTVIGLTEELPATARLLGQVFPFLNTTLDDVAGFGVQPTMTKKTVCPLQHDNASPANNRCVPGVGPQAPSTHWELPDHPDEATTAAILRHNQMDVALYEAAVQYFELQKRAMEGGEEEL